MVQIAMAGKRTSWGSGTLGSRIRYWGKGSDGTYCRVYGIP